MSAAWNCPSTPSIASATGYPHAGEKIMASLARLLAKRLIVANHKIEVLASY